LFDKEGTKLCGVFDAVVWRCGVLVAERVAPSVWTTVLEVPDCGRSIGWDVRPISYGFLAVPRHGRLFGDVVVTDGATIETALNSIVRFCLPQFEDPRKRRILQFPSVQCGEPDAEHIGDLYVSHAALTALARDYSHPWAIKRFATSASIAEAALVAERRPAFFLFEQKFERFDHSNKLAPDV
jgi:hypothetical protein